MNYILNVINILIYINSASNHTSSASVMLCYVIQHRTILVLQVLCYVIQHRTILVLQVLCYVMLCYVMLLENRNEYVYDIQYIVHNLQS